MIKKVLLSLSILSLGFFNISGASYLGDLVSSVNSFSNKFVSLGNSIINVLSYIFSIFKTLFYSLSSLLSGAWELIKDLYNGSLFDYLSSGFLDLSYFIGRDWALFFISLFSIILLSIIIGFVFKIFKLNLKGSSMYTKWKN